MRRPFFSIAIPTWEINGKGVEYLDYSLNIIAQQTFKDFEVVVSDHSQNDDIEQLCIEYNKVMRVKYYKNDVGRGKIAPNVNNAIRKSEGQYIKILFQDDFLFDIDSLETVHSNILSNKDKNWFVTSCVHTDDAVNV
jgi:glycosyltransferase involved in cell wall biosynthesis